MKILIVEDDPHTSEFLAAALSANRYAVDVVADGAAGLELAAQWEYDLIVLDVLLPVLNGIEVCRRLREQNCQTPILMVTLKDSNEDVIAGLDAGADDYIAKSCDISQLLARVRALLRRGRTVSSSPVLKWGQLCLDPASAQVTYDRQKVLLRPKEYNMLELFLRHPHRILSRSAIIDHLWSIEETPVEGSVTNLIKDLRQRLRAVGMNDDLIETVYGLGYRLKSAPIADKSGGEPQGNPAAKNVSESVAPVKHDKDWQIREQRGIQAIQQIQERFHRSLKQRIAALEAAEQSFQAGDCGVQKRNAARQEVHQLAGGLGTFGCAKASEIAREMEHLLEVKMSQESRLAKQFSQLLEQLKQELAIRV
jgi:DNA-binding response OmpR family regulator/HPt (histidine-containing phosphotransfer) domain-containing protein